MITKVCEFCGVDLGSNARAKTRLCKKHRRALPAARHCAECGLDISERHGLAKYCSKCAEDRVQIINLKWRDENREYLSAYERGRAQMEKRRDLRDAYYKTHKDDFRFRGAAWQRANREKVRASNRKWYEANTEKRRIAIEAWRMANPDKVREMLRISGHARRTRLAGNYGSHTPAEWLALVKAYRGRCAYCNKKPTQDDRLTADHVVPISRGGSDYIVNIVPAHRSCNASKNAKLLPDTQYSLFDRLLGAI